MRAAAPLFFLVAACASTSAPARTEVDVPHPTPAQPAPPAPLQQASAPALAERIVEAQRATGGPAVTPLFDAVRADLESDDGVRVLRGLGVIDEIGALIARAHPARPDMEELIGVDRLDPLADAIDELLDRLLRSGPCATAAEVGQTDAQFRAVPRTRAPSRPPPRRDAGGTLSKRDVSCALLAVQDEIAACFARYKVPGVVMVTVVIARSGKVSSAIANGAFAGTPTGACVEGAVKTAVFRPSDGFIVLYPFALK